MPKFNIERNPLDYLLTDTQPYEISEVFTYNYFYNYLSKNSKMLDPVRSDLIDNYRRNKLIFNGEWNATPHVFYISKKDGSLRKMSLMQPISALQTQFFIEIYQKDILNAISSPKYSIRYHVKNNRLFYSSKKNRLIDYKYKVTEEEKRRSIERSNSFFRIKEHPSIISFYNSSTWEKMNLKYKIFAKLDYKSCFDSIYSHSFKWIVSKDTIDSKNMKNASLYPNIDRILQNINGASSNGVIVGPEFSRMIVEVLLQHIDKEIYNTLLNESLHNRVDYEIFRYVDDFFVFANDKGTIEKIIQSIDLSASNYLLSLNRQKNEVTDIPFIIAFWIYDSDIVKQGILSLCQSNLSELKDDDRYLLKFTSLDIEIIKRNFDKLMVLYKNDIRTITSYFLSVILNKLSDKKEYLQIFRKGSSSKKIRSFIDLIFYVYRNSTSFDNTQKLISILYYLDIELKFQINMDLLDPIVQKYNSLFASSNIYDVINILLMLSRYNIALPYNVEETLINTIFTYNDPILIATYLLYAKYNNKYFNEILDKLSNVLSSALDNIQDEKNILLYKEFWFVLVFNHCPFIDSMLQIRINSKIKVLTSSTSSAVDAKTKKLIGKFLTDENNNFITWRIENIDIVKDITFRTHRRTIFRKYGKAGDLFQVSV